MNKCPHCGSTEGFSIRSQVTGTSEYSHNWNMKEESDYRGRYQMSHDNSHMYDSLNFKQNKYAECLDCGKRVLMETITATLKED